MRTARCFLCAVCTLLVACTVDLPVGADGPVADASAQNQAEAGRATRIDGDADLAADVASRADASAEAAATDYGCGVSMVQEAPFVDIAVVVDPVPTFMGGTISPGTYALRDYRVYGAGPRGTGRVREMLRVTGSPSVGAYDRVSEMIETTGDFKAASPRATRYTYESQGQGLFQSETCPGSFGGEIVMYRASSTALTLFDASTLTERVYTRIR